MRPSDHPQFFKFPAPEGRSRESTIRLDGGGNFFHNEERVDHAKLAAAMHTWISRHPDDHRFILTNGYDWTYFTVEDAPFFVRTISLKDEDVLLNLSDGSLEPWRPEESRTGEDNALYTTVKRAAPGGPYEAKFTRHAQSSLAPLLEERNGQAVVTIAGKTIPIGRKSG